MRISKKNRSLSPGTYHLSRVTLFLLSAFCLLPSNLLAQCLTCGGSGGGSGGVNPGTAGQFAWYATTGSTVSGNANATVDSSGNAVFATVTIGAGQVIHNLPRTFTVPCCGSDDAPALTTAQVTPQKSLLVADQTMVIDTILVKADSGASTIQLAYRHSSGGAPTTTPYTAAVMTPATVSNITDQVVCSNAAGTAITVDGVSVTCGTLATQTWTAGDSIETIGGTADGMTKRLSITIFAHIS
ncbi:MAG: hypothetical protein WB780_20295 [Candidatus Acidiferrales bacterium]